MKTTTHTAKSEFDGNLYPRDVGGGVEPLPGLVVVGSGVKVLRICVVEALVDPLGDIDELDDVVFTNVLLDPPRAHSMPAWTC